MDFQSYVKGLQSRGFVIASMEVSDNYPSVGGGELLLCRDNWYVVVPTDGSQPWGWQEDDEGQPWGWTEDSGFEEII